MIAVPVQSLDLGAVFEMSHANEADEEEVVFPPEDQLRTIINTFPTLVWSARPDGSAEFFNRRWLDYTGLSAEQALDWGWTAAIHPDDRGGLVEYWRSILASGDPGEIEARLRRCDGEFRWFLFRGSPLRDASGTVVKWCGTNTDIDDRKRAEKILSASELDLRLILDSIPGLVATNSPTGETEHVNRQMLEYFGKTLEDLKRWRTIDAVHPDDLARVVSTIETWMRSDAFGGPYEFDLRLRRADGLYRWFYLRALPAHDTEGRVVRWYHLLTDIDDRKRAEERVHAQNLALSEQVAQAAMFEEIVGASAPLRSLLSLVSKVAPTDSTVLITGETGTGKELVARAIHKRSPRATRAFISLNCAVIPSALIASELFGHEKGAFTGALQRRLGRFELAEGGTIFLDEIGELPSETQVALLRVLQERTFERVGGTEVIHVDVRVIVATNRDLSAAIAAGSFRRDLFYRLNVFPIEMPPLRARTEDIPMLVQYFIDRYGSKAGKRIRGVDQTTLDLMRSYAWPGNIRELQNVIERAVILCETDTLSVDESWFLRAQAAAAPPDSRLTESVHAHEKALIESALAASKGRVSGRHGAAARLGMAASTLDAKIRSLKINKHQYKRL